MKRESRRHGQSARRYGKMDDQMELMRQSVEMLNANLIEQNQVSLMIHFNERFHDLAVKVANELSPEFNHRASRLQQVRSLRRQNGGRHVANVDQLYGQELPGPEHEKTARLFRYYQAYWLLQWDQYTCYQHGLLPRWLYEQWLMQRRENYNAAEFLEYLLPLDSAADQEIGVERRNTEREQSLYRDGWKKAKQYYGHFKPGFQEFADKLDALMMADREDRAGIQNALELLLDRDGLGQR